MKDYTKKFLRAFIDTLIPVELCTIAGLLIMLGASYIVNNPHLSNETIIDTVSTPTQPVIDTVYIHDTIYMELL